MLVMLYFMFLDSFPDMRQSPETVMSLHLSEKNVFDLLTFVLKALNYANKCKFQITKPFHIGVYILATSKRIILAPQLFMKHIK